VVNSRARRNDLRAWWVLPLMRGLERLDSNSLALAFQNSGVSTGQKIAEPALIVTGFGYRFVCA